VPLREANLLAVIASTPVNDVAKVMGHEQTSTTLDRYTHSTNERDRRILKSFAAFSLPSIIAARSENEEDPSVEGP
jgi:integrase